MARNIVQNSEHGSLNPITANAQHPDLGQSQSESSADAIRERAYFIFLARNGAAGDAETDWKQAERELRAEAGRKNRPGIAAGRVWEGGKEAGSSVSKGGNAPRPQVSTSGR